MNKFHNFNFEVGGVSFRGSTKMELASGTGWAKRGLAYADWDELSHNEPLSDLYFYICSSLLRKNQVLKTQTLKLKSGLKIKITFALRRGKNKNFSISEALEVMEALNSGLFIKSILGNPFVF